MVHRLSASFLASRPARAVLAGATLCLLASGPAGAQEAGSSEPAGSRAELITRAQAEKSRNLHPYEPTRAERIVLRVTQSLAAPPNGFYPTAGSVYSGGGLALGLGYRHWYGDAAIFNAQALYSIRSYKLVELGTIVPGRADGRLAFSLRGGWRDATQVAFYGLGMSTSSDDRANYRFKQTFAGGGVTFRPLFPLVVAGGFTYEDYRLESGLGRAPSIEERYTRATAPALGISPAFLHGEVAAGIDWRTSPGYSRTGGYYGLTFHDYEDVDDRLTFRRLDADLVQHIPILRETWVVSLRGRVESTLGDDVVPYFLMPSLGSGSTLRAYSTGRFRDRHSLLTSAEFRWIPSRLALDMALFVDAGKVAARRQDLDFDNLTSNWGLGVRFHGPISTPLRIEMARGREGWHLVFASGAAF
jgi:hypothetical protein